MSVGVDLEERATRLVDDGQLSLGSTPLAPAACFDELILVW